ncbi:MAG TPA: FKBP-type peptidyl-prolyl cis-trans isomerase [Myxococcaceae bacterium]|nr:FKBP-type peptidyl-prolyl cis-trans isomerase [Myxococcaceae bacterium]
MQTKLGWAAIVGLILQAACTPAVEVPAPARQSRAAKTPAQAKQEGEAFLAANARKEGVVTLPSGLQYQVIKQGEGKTPQDGDKVVVHYRLSFVDGTELDNTYARGRPGTFELARMIPGYREAVKLMPVGSKWRMVIPAALAYGERGIQSRKKTARRIGPNSTLVYETELLSILPGGTSPQTAASWTPVAQEN